MFTPRRSILALVVSLWLTANSCVAQQMTAHYIDVGQADATLLEFPCGAILIDAGAQSQWYVGRLITYLDAFFEAHPELEGTLESVIVTHPHIDHNRGLRRVLERYNVKRYIDTGWTGSSGGPTAKWVRRQIDEGALDIKLVEITDDAVTDMDSKHGLTNTDIDPISCPNCDPEIRVLASRLLENPGWATGKFENQNNHSMVIRVDFGMSSFLFTGDLEEPAIETMVDWYSGTDTLDIDVYQVGHHGSHNGTTPSLLTAMTPSMAVISCGKPGSTGTFSAYSFGHPRQSIVSMIERGVSGTRTPAKSVKVAKRAKSFTEQTMGKAIYATPWDKTVKIRGRLNADPVYVP